MRRPPRKVFIRYLDGAAVAKAPTRSSDGSRPTTEVSAATFDFHGLFSVRVGHRRLLDLVGRELEALHREMDRTDLSVEEGRVILPERLLSYPWDDATYSFDESSFVFETPSGGVAISKGFVKAEPGVSAELLLEQWIMNLMRPQIVARGSSLVHSSAVSKNGVGYLFPAWAHSGKTNVALSLLANGYDYMSDDWSFVSRTGQILAYPRWLRVFDYNLQCHPFLRKTLGGRRETRSLGRRLAATEFAYTLDRSNLVSKRLRLWLLERYGVFLKVPASTAVPGTRTVLQSRLSKACLLATTRAERPSVVRVSPEALAAKAVACSRFERIQFLRHGAALAFSGHSELEDLAAAERAVLTEAFAKAQCMEVCLPRKPSPQDLEQVRTWVESA